MENCLPQTRVESAATCLIWISGSVRAVRRRRKEAVVSGRQGPAANKANILATA